MEARIVDLLQGFVLVGRAGTSFSHIEEFVALVRRLGQTKMMEIYETIPEDLQERTSRIINAFVKEYVIRIEYRKLLLEVPLNVPSIRFARQQNPHACCEEEAQLSIDQRAYLASCIESLARSTFQDSLDTLGVCKE